MLGAAYRDVNATRNVVTLTIRKQRRNVTQSCARHLLGRPKMLRKAVFTLGLLALSFGSIGVLFAADAQQPAKEYRIGFLGVNPSSSDRPPQDCPVEGDRHWQALVEGLRERGYVQGQNLVIACRYTEGREERALPLATELASLKVDLLVASSATNVRAAKEASSTIPIVMVGVIDPAGRKLVTSLARPGGNVTGPADEAGVEMAGKYLQLLKETVPKVSRVAVLTYATLPPEPVYNGDLEVAARALKVALQYHLGGEPEKLAEAFAAMTEERAEGLLLLPHPFMWTHAQRIIDLAAQSRLPAVYPDRDFVKEGGLLSYGVDMLAVRRRGGFYVDRILRGARPADLPVERPIRFELLINLRTAKTLGIAIPQSLLLRADEVIE